MSLSTPRSALLNAINFALWHFPQPDDATPGVGLRFAKDGVTFLYDIIVSQDDEAGLRLIGMWSSRSDSPTLNWAPCFPLPFLVRGCTSPSDPDFPITVSWSSVEDFTEHGLPDLLDSESRGFRLTAIGFVPAVHGNGDPHMNTLVWCAPPAGAAPAF